MTHAGFRKWVWVHKWASLICTLFLLMVCITGLTLVFMDEIDDWLDDSLPFAELTANTPSVSLDKVAQISHGMYPGEIITLIFIDDDSPKIVVSMAPSWKAFRADKNERHFIRFDSRTAQVLKQSKPLKDEKLTFTGLMLQLHKDMFAGLTGQLFLAGMGALFVIAIISGIVIYGPFMQRLDFGTVRADRSRRVKWLDLHNLLGGITLAWALVVGLTGVMNELSIPLFKLWQQTDVKAILQPFNGQPVPTQSELISVQRAYEIAQAAVPGTVVTNVVYPGSEFGSPYHYLVWSKGKSALTSRLFSPILVDARTGKLEGVVTMPWYLRALEVSRPLHFGDYGGLPLKIIWVLLDISGLYLWLSRRTSPFRATNLTASSASSASALQQGAAE